MAALSPRHDLQDIFRDRLDRFTKTLSGVEQGDARSVHRARVASRRLRELVPLLQFERAASRKVSKKLKRATRNLGAVRELDVTLALVEELQQSRRYADRALRQVASDIRRTRDEEWREFKEQERTSQLRRVARKLGKRIQDAEQDVEAAASEEAQRERGWRWALDARLAKRARTLRQAIDHAGAVYLAERVHAVRIALKKVRYGVEVAADAGMPAGAELKALKRNQELLGRLHDLQVLTDRVRRVQANLERPSASLSRELNMLVAGLEQSCRRLHARYVRDRQYLVELCDRLVLKGMPSTRSMRKAG
jgi:CHAD domain-containing protein